MSTNSINSYVLSRVNQITTMNLIFSILDLGLLFCSLLFIYFYLKKIRYINSQSYLFILFKALNGLMKYLLANNNSLYKAMLFYIIYIIQFHLVISSINAILTGKYLFKIYNKDFSIKNILLIEILFLPIILFPYSNFFNGYKIMISIIQNIIIII